MGTSANIQASLSELPALWRTACVTSAMKKDNCFTFSKYRPIPLTSVLYELMEHFLASCLTTHLHENNLLRQFQHGFRKRFSTVTQLFSSVNDFATSLDKICQTDVILLYFSKVCDCVHKGTIVSKLEKGDYGISNYKMGTVISRQSKPVHGYW